MGISYLKNNKIFKKFGVKTIAAAMIGLSSAGLASGAVNSIIDSNNPVNGWMTANQYFTPQDITYMKSRFLVPNSPKENNSQTVYFFPSIVTRDYGAILQPVLTYAVNNSDSATFKKGVGPWALSAFYVSDKAPSGKRRNSSITIPARPGDKIYSSVFKSNIKDSKGNYQWTIFINNETLHKNVTWKTYVAEKRFNTAFPAAMEAYSLTSCKQLPTSSFKLTDFHTYNSSGKEMTTGSYMRFKDDEACSSKLTQNTAAHWTTITPNNN